MLKHRWDVSPGEARDIQTRMAAQVHDTPLGRSPRTVGGLDVHESRGAVAVLSWPDLRWVSGAIVEHPVAFPYVPGLLSFREVPVLLATISRLDVLPDLLMCDGHGLAHPRRFGLACHLGVWLDHPTLGCAKTRLCGHHGPLASERGSTVPLEDGSIIGAVVRTRTHVRPVYVSVGHLVSLEEAISAVLHCASRFRLPEPLRAAHTMAKMGCYPTAGTAPGESSDWR